MYKFSRKGGDFVNLFELFATIGLKDDGFTQGVEKARDSFISFSEKASDIGDKIAGIGKSLSNTLTNPILDLGKNMITSSIDFESAFVGVRKTVDATEEQFAKLEQGFIDLSTVIPTSASDLAKIGEAAGQLGIKTENILGFTKVIADLGNATNLVGEEGAMQLAKFANIVGMSQKDFDRLGSTIVALGNNFQTTEADIVRMAMRLAGAGEQVGMTEPEIMALATALSSVGIEAEMGGSAISKVIINMSAAGATSKQLEAVLNTTGMSLRELEMMASHNSKGFGELAASLGMTKSELNDLLKNGTNLENFAKIAGMTGEEFKQAFEKDAVGALQAFIKGLGGAENAGSSAIEMLAEMGISEVRLRDSLLRAANAQDLFTDAVDLANTAWEENTALTKEAEQRYESTESKIQLLKNGYTKLSMTFGELLLPYLEKAVEWLGEVVDWFSNLDDSGKKTILMIGGFVAALGPVITVIGNVIKVFSTLGTIIPGISTAITALSGAFTFLAANPIGLVIAAVAALVVGVTALVLWFANEETAILSVEKATENLKEAKENLKKATEDLETATDSYVKSIEQAAETQKKLREAEEKLGISGKQLAEQVANGTLKYRDMTDVQLEVYAAYMENEAAQNKLANSSATLTEATNELKNAKEEETKAHWDNELALAAAKKDYDTYRDAVVDAFKKGEISAEQAQETLSKAMTGMSNDVRKAFTKDMPTDIKEGLDPQHYETTGQKITNWFKNVGNGMIAGFKKIFKINSPSQVMIEIAGNVMDGFQSGAEKKESSVWNKLSGIFGSFLDVAKDLPGKFLTKGQEIVDKFRDGAGNVIENAKEKVKGFFGKFPESIQDVPSKFLDKGKEIVNNFQDGVGNVISGAVSKVSSHFDKFKSTPDNVEKEMGKSGKDVVNGFVKGIGDVIDGAVKKVTGFFGKITDAVKGLFGISSPSKLFAYFGEMNVEGLVKGFADNVNSAKTKVEGYLDDMFSDMDRDIDIGVNPEFNPNNYPKSPASSVGTSSGSFASGNRETAEENSNPIEIHQHIQAVPQTASEFAAATAAQFAIARWNL